MPSVYSQLISSILKHWGEGEFTARELAERYNLNYNSVRRYLGELTEAGYLAVRKDGRVNYYKLINPQKLSEVEERLSNREALRDLILKIQELTEEFAKVRSRLSQIEAQLEVLRNEPSEPVTLQEDLSKVPDKSIVSSAKDSEKSTIEQIMDILYELYTRKNVIKCKEPRFEG